MKVEFGIYIWCIFSLCLVYTSICLVYTWYIFDIYLVYYWFMNGILLVYEWYIIDI